MESPEGFREAKLDPELVATMSKTLQLLQSMAEPDPEAMLAWECTIANVFINCISRYNADSRARMLDSIADTIEKVVVKRGIPESDLCICGDLNTVDLKPGIALEDQVRDGIEETRSRRGGLH